MGPYADSDFIKRGELLIILRFMTCIFFMAINILVFVSIMIQVCQLSSLHFFSI